MNQYANPDVLVETAWLADHLQDPLRVWPTVVYPEELPVPGENG